MLYSLLCIICFLISSSSSQSAVCSTDPIACMESLVGDWCFAIYEPLKVIPIFGQVALTLYDLDPPITSTVGSQSVVNQYLAITGDNPPEDGFPNITLVDVTTTDKITYIIADLPDDHQFKSFVKMARLPGKMKFETVDKLEAVFNDATQFDGYVMALDPTIWIEGPGGYQIPDPYPVPPAIYEAGNSKSYYYVKGNRGLCPTSSPTPSPTPSPTLPTPSPTPSPTFTGQTYSPTMSPTTSSPTMSPTTLSPTGVPTMMPTNAPTMMPTTMSPTASPTIVDSSSKILQISAIIGVVMFGSMFSFSF